MEDQGDRVKVVALEQRNGRFFGGLEELLVGRHRLDGHSELVLIDGGFGELLHAFIAADQKALRAGLLKKMRGGGSRVARRYEEGLQRRRQDWIRGNGDFERTVELIRTLIPALKKPSMVVMKVIASGEEMVSGGGKENRF